MIGDYVLRDEDEFVNRGIPLESSASVKIGHCLNLLNNSKAPPKMCPDRCSLIASKLPYRFSVRTVAWLLGPLCLVTSLFNVVVKQPVHRNQPISDC